MDSTTRAQFFARGWGEVKPRPRRRHGVIRPCRGGRTFGATDSDADVAKLAATAELLAIDFYTHAINSGSS